MFYIGDKLLHDRSWSWLLCCLDDGTPKITLFGFASRNRGKWSIYYHYRSHYLQYIQYLQATKRNLQEYYKSNYELRQMMNKTFNKFSLNLGRNVYINNNTFHILSFRY